MGVNYVDYHHLGRETFLAPVRWDDEGWPIVNDGKTIDLEMTLPGLTTAPTTAPDARGLLRAVIGGLELSPQSGQLALLDQPAAGLAHAPRRTATLRDAMSPGVSPTFVGRRQEHLACRTATLLDFLPERDGDEAGLTVFMNGEHRYDLGVRRRAGRREVFVRQTIGPDLSASTAHAMLSGDDPVTLEVRAEPEEYTFWYRSGSGAPQQLGAARSHYLSSEVAGGFTGVYLGLYATGNGHASTTPARFDWFDYEPR